MFSDSVRRPIHPSTLSLLMGNICPKNLFSKTKVNFPHSNGHPYERRIVTTKCFNAQRLLTAILFKLPWYFIGDYFISQEVNRINHIFYRMASISYLKKLPFLFINYQNWSYCNVKRYIYIDKSKTSLKHDLLRIF